jgi:NADH:ubiquinone oxidoreductase subunit H
MELILRYAIPIALAAVAVVLLMGLWNMMRGGNPGRSQILMRWRVGLQFLAIIIIMAALYFANRPG